MVLQPVEDIQEPQVVFAGSGIEKLPGGFAQDQPRKVRAHLPFEGLFLLRLQKISEQKLQPGGAYAGKEGTQRQFLPFRGIGAGDWR
ncbi:hypothetical protein SDC9_196001 [bioreactor metagenome]|uniref:Uncharacterized protein n=1 Tax=bioreactor metagenome TaxID=1076179 RepID=A0A645IJA7_9ZZZZ